MRGVVVAVVVALTAACPSSPPSLTSTTPATTAKAPATAKVTTWPTTVRLRGEAFASDWAVSVVVKNDREHARALALTSSIEATIAEIGRQLSAWDADAEVARFSAARHRRPLLASKGTIAAVGVALDVAARTDGAFDPTLGPLLDLWGFSPSTKGTVTSPPTAAAIDAARERVGYRHIDVDDGMLRKDRDDTTLDVTAIADGAAAAAVAAALRERGFASFLVDVAGEVVVSGTGEARPWRVGINTPSSDAAATDSVRQAVLSPSSSSLLALSTSGTYRDAWTADGHRYSHIIDPRTGRPVDHDLVSCTVVGADLVVADAVSTACVVLGEAATRRALAEQFPGYEALFIQATSPTAFTTTTTAGFPPAP